MVSGGLRAPPFFSANNVFKTIDGNKIPHFAPKMALKNISLPHAHPLLKILNSPFHIFQGLHFNFKILTFFFISKNCSVIPIILFWQGIYVSNYALLLLWQPRQLPQLKKKQTQNPNFYFARGGGAAPLKLPALVIFLPKLHLWRIYFRCISIVIHVF